MSSLSRLAIFSCLFCSSDALSFHLIAQLIDVGFLTQLLFFFLPSLPLFTVTGEEILMFESDFEFIFLCLLPRF